MKRTDHQAAQRDQAEAVAHRAAQQANGVFLRAFEVAVLSYQLQRIEAGADGGDHALAGYVRSLLDQRNIGPIELRATGPFKPPLTVAQIDQHPSTRCSQCGSPTMDQGGGYRECRKCGHGFLNVAPNDIALGTDTA